MFPTPMQIQPNQPVRTRQPRPIMSAIKNPCSCKGPATPAAITRNPVSFASGGGTIGPSGATSSGVSSGMSPSNNQFTFRTWNWPAWYYPAYAYPYVWPYPYAYGYPYQYPYPQPYAYPYQYAYGWSGWPGYYGTPWPYAPRTPVVA